MTWHQWHAEYPTDRRIGLSCGARFGQGGLVPGMPVHRVRGVLQEVGTGFVGEPVHAPGGHLAGTGDSSGTYGKGFAVTSADPPRELVPSEFRASETPNATAGSR